METEFWKQWGYSENNSILFTDKISYDKTLFKVSGDNQNSNTSYELVTDEWNLTD